MRRLLTTIVPIAALTCACVAITLADSCRADAINSWQGASASVNASGKQATDAGATASASTSGGYMATSFGSLGGPLTIGIGSGGSASASGNPDNLLQVTTSLTMAETGVLSAPISPSYPTQATASWNNDSLIVHAPAGVSLPSTVQLQFKIDLSPIAQISTGYGDSVVVGINGQDHYIQSNGLINSYGAYGGDGAIKLQAPQWYPGTDTPPHQTGTFTINLALHPDGVSDPFSVSLLNGQTVGPVDWTYMLSNKSSISLSLTAVTLPDGTSLTADGYGVSFASGLTLPEQPVPEPATFVVWGLLGAAALSVRHRVLTPRIGR
jgi:hypothetical protein